MLRPRDGVGEVRPLLETYLAGLAWRIPLRAAAVFGSRARGDHRRGSDIDLVVVSDAFGSLRWDERIGRLLEDWRERPALEAVGYTSEELLRLDHLLLVDAVYDGRPLRDDGIWESARQRLLSHMQRGRLIRRPGGWSIRDSISPGAAPPA